MFRSERQQAKRDRMAALQPAGTQAALAERQRGADPVAAASAAADHDDDDDVEEAEGWGSEEEDSKGRTASGAASKPGGASSSGDGAASSAEEAEEADAAPPRKAGELFNVGDRVLLLHDPTEGGKKKKQKLGMMAEVKRSKKKAALDKKGKSQAAGARLNAGRAASGARVTKRSEHQTSY